MEGDLGVLETHVANFAALCAQKLRAQQTVASVVCVFISTNPFRADLPQHRDFCEVRLVTASNSTSTIANAAREGLRNIFRQGYRYKKAGVVVMGMTPENTMQYDIYSRTHKEYEQQKEHKKD